jgi:hypothetical protein
MPRVVARAGLQSTVRTYQRRLHAHIATTAASTAEPLKLATFRALSGGEARVGVVRGDRIW